VPDGEIPWSLERFVERLDLWLDLEHPEESLRLVVTEQIFTRMETPYRGVKRVRDGDNLWFGVVPEAPTDPAWSSPGRIGSSSPGAQFVAT
jgi:hypothetical protein